MNKVVNEDQNEANRAEFACKNGWWAVRLKKYASSPADWEGMEK